MTEEPTIEDLLGHVRTSAGGFIEPRMGRVGNFMLSQYINNQLSLDLDEERISIWTVAQELKRILFDVAQGDGEPAKAGRRFKDYVSTVKTSDFTEYEVAFPLNFLQADSNPTSFEIQGTTIEEISVDDWMDGFVRPAQEQYDERDLGRFIRKNPNDIDDPDGTYWKCKYEAHDPIYTTTKVRERVNLLIAKINYARTYMHGRPRSSSLPKTRWSNLRYPYVYFAFEDDDFVRYVIEDYDIRDPENLIWFEDDVRARFESIPELSEAPEGAELDVVNALLSYQDGITETSRAKSFFGFWRGVENLSQKERSQPGGIAVNRALFALDFVDMDYTSSPIAEYIISEVKDKRDTIAHEGAHIPTSELHQNHTKYMLDALLKVYFDHLDELSRDEFRTLLDYGSKSGDSIKRLNEDQNRLDIVESVLSGSKSLN